MKTEFEMTLFDNPKNREKATVLSPLEIIFDDSDNPEIPNIDVPWGAKIKVSIEVIE